jgi:transposase
LKTLKRLSGRCGREVQPKLLGEETRDPRSKHLFACYEAGACGYNVYRQIVATGHHCDVVAPSRIPRATGDRVKTDRRDAMMLARLHRSGDLTPVWVPDEDHEAMRDLVRSRIAAVRQRQVARQQLKAFLLRHGCGYRGMKAWSRTHLRWLSDQKFERPAQQAVFQDYVGAVMDADERVRRVEGQIGEQIKTWSMAPVVEALCTLRGVSVVAASSILAATGDLGRFACPRQLMAYFGLVPSEHSSGSNIRRGGITKTGNNEVRRLLIQSAWCYRFPARIGRTKVDAFATGPTAARQIAWKAQLRLTGRYRSLATKGKPVQVVVTAIARELLAFMCAIGQVTSPVQA